MKLVYEVNGSDVEALDLLDCDSPGYTARVAQRIAEQCDVGLSDVSMRWRNRGGLV